MMSALMNENDLQEVTLILVEDDSGEAKAVRRAFSKADFSSRIIHALDGVEALEMLRAPGTPTQYIMLVDINMPRMNGLELVQHIRRDAKFARSLIFMLTTSDDPGDIFAAQSLNVAGYIQKTRCGPDMAPIVRLVKDFWGHVEIPRAM